MALTMPLAGPFFQAMNFRLITLNPMLSVDQEETLDADIVAAQQAWRSMKEATRRETFRVARAFVLSPLLFPALPTGI